MIRPVEPEEIPLLAQLQLEALPGSLPNELGRRFLETYYRVLLPDPAFFCDVWVDAGRLVAFNAYASDAAAAFHRAVRAHAAGLGLAALTGVLARPARAAVLLRILRSLAPGYREVAGDVPAEILSVAVLPAYRGASIGSRLIERALQVLERAGAERIKVITKTAAQDPQVNRFFAGHGFRHIDAMVRFGHERNVHVRTVGGGRG